MSDKNENTLAQFLIKPWHPLTEIPERSESNSAKSTTIVKARADTDKSAIDQPLHPSLHRVSSVLKKLLWDILVYQYSSVSVRIRRLGVSCSAFENAKHEGCEKGFIIESSNGQTTYLIPTEKTFEVFGMPCPYKRNVSIDHSFRVGLGCFLLDKDPRYKSVQPEVKLGSSGSTSDIVTIAHDGTREAWEVTLSTTNILSNATKYENTAFAKIVFLCRDYKLKEAVKACCRESGLNPDLLARLEYTHFSALLRRQRKLSLY